MSTTSNPPSSNTVESVESDRRQASRPGLAARARKALGFGNISAVYVWIICIAVFSIWKSGNFPTYNTFTEVLNGNAVTGLVALGLVIPLAAGVFDLSVGFTLGSTSVFLSFLLGHGWGTTPAIIAALALGLAIGFGNALIVVGLGIDSFIGTLATGSLLNAFILAITGNVELVNNVSKVQFLAFDTWHQLTIPVAVMFVVGAVLWYFLSHTAQGRFVYATGLGEEQARLAGIRTNRLRFASLMVSGFIAGLAGILETAIVGAGSPTVGPSYLIPAFAAVFLGATQLKDGLWNAWGTIIAVLLLGTIQIGLALANVPEWVPYVVDGAVLIIALGLRRWQTQRVGKVARNERRERRMASKQGAAEVGT